jgi:glycosyltransferase involved in cell wall biosynthesis
MRELQPTPRAFTARAGMLFVGAFHEMDSPNYDGLCWFVDQVLPLIEPVLRWETRLTVVGYSSEKVSLDRFHDHQRVTLLGTVAQTERLYDSHRLFIAPTRYAAGTPYKLHEAASFGLPIVATDLLRRQTGWTDGVDLLAADSTDPAGFAARVVRLYRDAELWQRLRDNALQRLRTENAREQYAAAMRAVLEV